MKNKSLKNKLKLNELTLGSWLTIGHPAIAEILCNYPFDWLTIDIEHNLFDPSQIRSLISIIQSKEKAALVRVSKNEEVVIKHVLDAGADGVIVPMVNSKEDAQKAVEFVYYPPFGKRGVGLSRAQNYGDGFESYKEWLNDHVVIVAQIEHIDGIRNLKDIISTPGIDAIIVGPYDLSGSLGYPGEYHREEVIEALKYLEETCVENKFPMGYHVVPPDSDLFSKTKEKGYKFIALSTDFLFLGNSLKRFMESI
ncbi:aldolase/citrate lyase family protein [Algoriphagus sp. SE2]|uniref:HpcH/HpaI aldolase family protein n=1 Tax=Algoriphagus sp. SE2 TaxID=3141536 RepID=UPI0031CD0E28